MQTIRASVGDSGTNAASDVALLQAILLKTARRPTPAAPYLSSCDGICGPITKGAIRAFQADHELAPPNPAVAAGLVRPGDATWTKLLENVDRDFSDMRVLGTTVYVAAPNAQLQRNIAAANADTFTAGFRVKVIACINRMHALHSIAINVCPKGDRRDFQTQYELLASGRGVTNAGPGESNHNFGMAVDLGFAGLRWLNRDGGVIENETSWLHRLDAHRCDQAMLFWEALRAVGTSGEVGAFRGPVADRPHLQNWDDSGVVMAARLADLLTRSGTMRWSGTRGSYATDLGLGGALIPIGTAAQIWNRQAAVTVEVLTRARELGVASQEVRSQGFDPQPQNQPHGAHGAARPATPTDVLAMQQALRHEFELADANWQNWTAR
ncbi:hypothetical protein [Massilia sp. TWR1-2-2]|uniref:hypothetical protein n=1 Tax=Massilia sp. TWR1-2-2 TaxID=2804584 RepID=UPI003CEF734D